MELNNALAISNFFVFKAPLSHLKIQKLVYLSHCWYLALTGEPLLQEKIRRYKYGPIIQSIFDYYHSFEFADEICYPLAYYSDESNGNFQYYQIDDFYATCVCQKVWEEYRDMTDLELSSICHAEGTPWDKSKGSYVDNNIIVKYYKEKINENKTSSMD